jgi:hypothetical protein
VVVPSGLQSGVKSQPRRRVIRLDVQKVFNPVEHIAGFFYSDIRLADERP